MRARARPGAAGHCPSLGRLRPPLTASGVMPHMWGNPHFWHPHVGVQGGRRGARVPRPLASAPRPRIDKPQHNRSRAAALRVRGGCEGRWHGLCYLSRTTAAGSGELAQRGTATDAVPHPSAPGSRQLPPRTMQEDASCQAVCGMTLGVERGGGHDVISARCLGMAECLMAVPPPENGG